MLEKNLHLLNIIENSYRINGVLKFPASTSIDDDDVAAKPYQNVNTERLMDKKRTNTNTTFQILKLEIEIKKEKVNQLVIINKKLIHTHNHEV